MTTIEYKKIVSNTIANINFPLMVGVIVAHCLIYNSGNIIMDNIAKMVMILVVSIIPIFFSISGYLLFIKTDYNFKEIIGKRIKTLLIPYLIANIFMILCYAAMHYFTPTLINPNNFNVLKFSFKDFLQAFWSIDGFPICYPLWYIRDLFCFIVCSPLLHIILKLPKLLKWSILLIIGFIYHYYSISFCMGLFYFYLGALLSQKDTENKIIEIIDSKRFLISTCIVSALLMFVAIYFNYTDVNVRLWQPIQRFSGFIFTLFTFILFSKKYGQIGGKIFNSSFFIYLYHAFLVFVLKELLIMVINPTSTIMWIITYISLILITIFILVSAFFILNKYLPSFTAIITGGRSNKK